jgi:outer membrane protein assembly factor BamB
LIKSNQAIYYLIGEDFAETELLINVNLINADSSTVIKFINNDSINEYRVDFIVEDDYIFYSKVENKLVNNIWNSTPYISKYQRKSGKILYETRLEDSDLATNVGGLTKFKGTSILAVTSRNIINVDERSGKLIWSVPIPSNLFYPEFLTTDSGLLYVVTEDNLMCLDIASGSVVWDVVPEHLGLNSRMVLHKGTLYFVSGGRLNAFDAVSGQQLMSLLAPSIEWSGVSDNFQSVMTLDAENDRIYTASYTAAYCYPTLTK